mgnify:CR=1 FL=1
MTPRQAESLLRTAARIIAADLKRPGLRPIDAVRRQMFLARVRRAVAKHRRAK